VRSAIACDWRDSDPQPFDGTKLPEHIGKPIPARAEIDQHAVKCRGVAIAIGSHELQTAGHIAARIGIERLEPPGAGAGSHQVDRLGNLALLIRLNDARCELLDQAKRRVAPDPAEPGLHHAIIVLRVVGTRLHDSLRCLARSRVKVDAAHQVACRVDNVWWCVPFVAGAAGQGLAAFVGNYVTRHAHAASFLVVGR
jgi:hypothetical protein